MEVSASPPEKPKDVVAVSAKATEPAVEVAAELLATHNSDASAAQQSVVSPPRLVVVPDIEPKIEPEPEPEPETAPAQEPQPKPNLSQAPAAGSAIRGQSSTEVPTDLLSSEDWIAIFQQLPLEGMLKSICGQLSFRTREMDFLTFDIDQAASGVLSDKYQSKFCELLKQYLGQNIELSIESQANSNESPLSRAQRLHSEALEAAENELMKSEAAQKLCETFGATLVPGSVNLK